MPSYGNPIIEEVSSYIQAAAAISHAYTFTRSLANDISKDPAYKTLFDSSFFPNSGPKRLRTRDLFKFMVACPDDERRKRLVETVWSSDSIPDRFAYLSESVLGTPRLLKDCLEQQKRLVGWQVRRIYRERNRIVHSGSSSKLLPSLLDNLISYQGMTLRTLLHDLRQHPDSTVKHAIEFRKSRFNEFIALLPQPDLARRISMDAVLDATVDDVFDAEPLPIWNQ